MDRHLDSKPHHRVQPEVDGGRRSTAEQRSPGHQNLVIGAMLQDRLGAVPRKTLVTVGEAARAGGVTPKAVRLYETKRLLPPAERTESGYRLYSRQDVEVLQFIRQAKALGLSLEEIREILDLQRGGEQPCGQVLRLLDQHIEEINRAMADLRALRTRLAAARDVAKQSARRGEQATVCRIIESEEVLARS